MDAFELQCGLNQLRIKMSRKVMQHALDALNYCIKEAGPCEHECGVCVCMESNAAYALREELAKPDGWQPIDTAPKDGQCILWVETDDGGDVMKLVRDGSGNWIYDGEPTYCAVFYIEPTHWMPLPKAPI